MLSGSTPTTTSTPEQLIDRLANGSPRQRRSLIKSLESRSADLVSLGSDALAPFDRKGADWAPGWILQVIRRHQPDHLAQLLSSTPEGWLSVASAIGVDYRPLQQALLDEDFETADRTTSSILRQLAGPAAEARGYVYFSEVPAMAGLDLVSLDRLWTVYSQGRYDHELERSPQRRSVDLSGLSIEQAADYLQATGALAETV